MTRSSTSDGAVAAVSGRIGVRDVKPRRARACTDSAPPARARLRASIKRLVDAGIDPEG